MQPKEYDEEWLNSPAGSNKSDKRRNRPLTTSVNTVVDKYRVLDTPAAAMVGAKKGKAHRGAAKGFFVADTEQVSAGVRIKKIKYYVLSSTVKVRIDKYRTGIITIVPVRTASVKIENYR